MEARYGYVTLDGDTRRQRQQRPASAATRRQFEFEVGLDEQHRDRSKCTKPSAPTMPADAPAGTINLRSKSALDRKGARFNYTRRLHRQSIEYLTFKKTPRHDDAKHAKTRPTGHVRLLERRSSTTSSASRSTARSPTSSRSSSASRTHLRLHVRAGDRRGHAAHHADQLQGRPEDHREVLRRPQDRLRAFRAAARFR